MDIPGLSVQQWAYTFLTVVVLSLAFIRAFHGRFGPPPELVETVSSDAEATTSSKNSKEDEK